MMLWVELTKCKADHDWELELIRIKHSTKAQELEIWIDNMFNYMKVLNDHQGLLTWVVNEGLSEISRI